MAFHTNTAGYPTILLTREVIHKLLKAIQQGTIDMAYFPELYHPRLDHSLDSVEIPQEEMTRFNSLWEKITFSTDGQVLLTRELKLRLLKAIRANEINLLTDFPELARAYQAVQQDWSALTPDEREFLLDFCIKYA